MLRLIGILTGVAIAIGLLIIALGVPEFSPEEAMATPEPERQPISSVPLPDPAHEPLVSEPASDPVIEPAPEQTSEPIPEPEPTAEDLIEQIFNPEPEAVVEENWYAFWSPFRSELAANGFVTKLQETTGIDYRVVKVKTGVYEVAFAYSDDADIQDKLARISSATGLDMSGG